MVKNTHGGNKSKGMARKGFIKKANSLRIAQEDGEIYAQAVKVMGGAIASATDVDGAPLEVHIRGKFRGRGKRDNFISPGTWLLVGLHSWEGDKTTGVRKCDLLEVYNEDDKNRLRETVTSVNWSKFVSADTKIISATDKFESDIVFTDDVTQEYEDLINNELNNSKNTKTTIIDDEEIDFNDI